MSEFNEFFVSGDEEKISALAESNDDLTSETQRVLAETVSELNILRQQFELERTDNATKDLIKQSVQYKLQRLYARADARRVIAEMLEFSPNEIEGFNEKYLEFQEIVSSINWYLQSASAVFSPNFLSDYPVFSLRFTKFVSSLDDDVKKELIAVSESDSALNNLSSVSEGAQFSFNEVCELKSVYDSVNALNNLQASNTEASFRSRFDSFKRSFQSVTIGSEHSELILNRVSLLSSHFATLTFNQGDRKRLITYLRSNNIRVDLNNLNLNDFTSLYEKEERPDVKSILSQFIISLVNFQKDFKFEFLVPISLQANLELLLAQKIADGDLESADTLLFMTRRTFPDLDTSSLSSSLRSIDNTRLMELIHADSQDLMHEQNRFTSNVDRESNQKILDLLNLMVIRNDSVNSLKEAYFCLKDIYSSNRLDELAIRGYFNMHQVEVYDTIVDLRNSRRYFASDSSLFFMYFEQNVNRVDSIDTFNTDLYESLKLEQRHNLARSYIEGFLQREYGKVFSSLIENDSQLKADYESYQASLFQEFCTSKKINSDTVMTESLLREYSIFLKYSLRNYVTNVVRHYLIDNRDNIHNIPNGKRLLELFDLANEDFDYEESLFNFTAENWNYFTEGLKRSLILAPAIMPLVAPSASVVTVGEVASIAPVAASAVSTSSGVFSFSNLGPGGIAVGFSALVHFGFLGSAYEYADRIKRFEITTLASEPSHFVTMTEIEDNKEFEYQVVLNAFHESENKSQYLMGLNFAIRADLISSLPPNELSGLESQVLTEHFSVMNNLDDTLKSQVHSQIRTLADNAMHLNVTFSKLNPRSAQNVAEVIKQDPNFASRSYLNLTKYVLGISDQVNLDEQISYFETQLPGFESYIQDKDVFANYVSRLNVETDRAKLPLVFLISEFHKSRELQMSRSRRGLISVPAEQTFAQALLGFRARVEQVQRDLESDSTRQIESIVSQWGSYNITNRSTLDLLAGDGGLCENRAIMSYLIARSMSSDSDLRMMHTNQLDPVTQDSVLHVELIESYVHNAADGSSYNFYRSFAPNSQIFIESEVESYGSNADDVILQSIQASVGLYSQDVDGSGKDIGARASVETLDDLNGYKSIISSVDSLVQDAPGVKSIQESANNGLIKDDPSNVVSSPNYKTRIQKFEEAFDRIDNRQMIKHKELIRQVFIMSEFSPGQFERSIRGMYQKKMSEFSLEQLKSGPGGMYLNKMSDELIDYILTQDPTVIKSLFHMDSLENYLDRTPARFNALMSLLKVSEDQSFRVSKDTNLVNLESNLNSLFDKHGRRIRVGFDDDDSRAFKFVSRTSDKIILERYLPILSRLQGLHVQIVTKLLGLNDISKSVSHVSKLTITQHSPITQEDLLDTIEISELEISEGARQTSESVKRFLIERTDNKISLSTDDEGLLKTVLDDAKASSVRVYSSDIQKDLEILSDYYARTSSRRQELKSQHGSFLHDGNIASGVSAVSASSLTQSSEVPELTADRLEAKKLNKVIEFSIKFDSISEFRGELERLKSLVKASDFKLHFIVSTEEMPNEILKLYDYDSLRDEFDSLRNIKVMF